MRFITVFSVIFFSAAVIYLRLRANDYRRGYGGSNTDGREGELKGGGHRL